MRRTELIAKLVVAEMERMDSQSLGAILQEGCRGFDNMSNEELVDVANDIYDMNIRLEDK